MKTKFYLHAAALFGALLHVAPAAHAAAEPVVMRLVEEIQIAAPPEAVWRNLAQGDRLIRWAPLWADPANAAIAFDRLGAHAAFRDEWGGQGVSIVTFADAPRELRVSNEPASGDYLCRTTIRLDPMRTGTRVRYIDEYSDASPEDTRRHTAATAAESLRHALVRLKWQVDRPASVEEK